MNRSNLREAIEAEERILAQWEAAVGPNQRSERGKLIMAAAKCIACAECNGTGQLRERVNEFGVHYRYVDCPACYPMRKMIKDSPEMVNK